MTQLCVSAGQRGFVASCLGCVLAAVSVARGMTAELPNVVVMLADDMGFGEVQSLNPTRGKIPTPRLDAIAAAGMVFTDAHSGSSVCTPTRYGLMTGRYAWRTRLQSGVVVGGESLIAGDRLTLAKLLRARGYHTAAIGKWHLGMLFDGRLNAGKVPIGARVSHGPLDRGGFDEFHGFHHARQMDVWIDDDIVTASVEPVEMLPRLTGVAVEYIRRRAQDRRPFFLYVPWNSPHGPVVPAPPWQGKSGLNAHADFVMQTDDSFGQVVEALRETGMLENTLILCSADNGTSAPTSNMRQLERLGHFPSGELRGSKADIWDGGHRVPFIVSWPGVVPSGARCDQLVCLTDVIATVADIIDEPLPASAAEDSISFLPWLTAGLSPSATTPENAPPAGRGSVVHHSIDGYFAIRQGPWKLCLCLGSGGWTAPKTSQDLWRRAEEQGRTAVQLYHLGEDLGEHNDRSLDLPEKVAELTELLQTQVDNGRSTPGPPQTNDVPVDIGKKPGRAIR